MDGLDGFDVMFGMYSISIIPLISKLQVSALSVHVPRRYGSLVRYYTVHTLVAVVAS
jgi:hypothetical protein